MKLVTPPTPPCGGSKMTRPEKTNFSGISGPSWSDRRNYPQKPERDGAERGAFTGPFSAFSVSGGESGEISVFSEISVSFLQHRRNRRNRRKMHFSGSPPGLRHEGRTAGQDGQDVYPKGKRQTQTMRTAPAGSPASRRRRAP
jgi:hypothetical protein